MGWLADLRLELESAARLREVLRLSTHREDLESELAFEPNRKRQEAFRRIFNEARLARQESLLDPLHALLDGGPGRLERDRRAGQMLALEYLERVAMLEAQLAPLLTSQEPAWVERVELALLHLQRSLVVDDTLRGKWVTTWETREENLEKLGAVHLLSHGLFGFKADAQGAATDLILGQPLQTEASARAGAPLVLTEWKKTNGSPKDVEEKKGSALKQLDLYQASVVAALWLRRTRFVILVSKRKLKVALPDRVLADGTVDRVVNIAIEPENASKEAKRTASGSSP